MATRRVPIGAGRTTYVNSTGSAGPAVRSNRILRTLLHVLAGLKLLGGVTTFPLTRRTTTGAYLAMRELHAATRGASTRLIARVLARRQQNPVTVASGVLGQLSLDDAMSLAKQINRDGFVVFPARLDARLCDELTELARTTAA